MFLVVRFSVWRPPPAPHCAARQQLQAAGKWKRSKAIPMRWTNERTKKKERKINWRTKIQWGKSIDEMKSGSRRAMRMSAAVVRARTRHIFYSWTIKMFCEKIFGAMRLFLFCESSLSPRSSHFLFSSSFCLFNFFSLLQHNSAQRQRKQRLMSIAVYLWLFLFSIFTFLLLQGIRNECTMNWHWFEWQSGDG